MFLLFVLSLLANTTMLIVAGLPEPTRNTPKPDPVRPIRYQVHDMMQGWTQGEQPMDESYDLDR